MQKHISKKCMAAFSAVVVGISAVFGGTWAYMTNTQSADNVFTIGNVEVKLTEPEWPGNDTPETTDITANQEIPKDPTITNTGTTDAVVFAEVEIPIDEYDIATAEGEPQGKAARELFWIKTKNTGIGEFKNTIHDADGEWNWLQSLCYYKDADGNFAEKPVSGGSAVHVFGYQTIVKPKESTVSIFDKVQLKNIILHEGDFMPAGKDIQINVRAFAIQGSYVLGENGDLTYDLSTENLEQIFERYCNQNNYELGTGNVHKDSSDNPDVPDEQVYKITLTGDGVKKEIIYADKEGKIKNLPIPERSGYTFTGWFNEQNEKVENEDTTEKDLVLTAVWELVHYSISYNLGGGEAEGLPSEYTVKSDGFTLNTPTKEGYIFAGWTGTDISSPEKTVTVKNGSTGNRTYTATWEKNDTEETKVTVTFKINNSDLDYADNMVTVAAGEPVSYTLAKSDRYSFDGWYTQAEGGKKLEEIKPEKNMTVYAHWTKVPQIYSVVFDSNYPDGGSGSLPETKTVTEGNTLGDLIPSERSRTGYKWLGWNTESDGSGAFISSKTVPLGDTTYYGTWEVINYAITYDLCGGINNSANPASYNVASSDITIADPVLDGYKFEGWLVGDSENITNPCVIAKGSTGDVNLTAVWSKVDDPVQAVAVTFNINNSDIGLPNKIVTVSAGSTAEYAPDESAYSGKYTFDGWYTEASGGEKLTEIKPAANMTVYAHWTKVKETYSVTFNPNYQGVSGTSTPVIKYVEEGNSIGDLLPIMQGSNGYQWLGWNTKADGSGAKITSATVPSENIVCYGTWKAISYKISYNLSGGTNNSANPSSYTVESSNITIEEPARSGYTFTGWLVGSSETPVKSYVISKGAIGDISLKAVWEKNGSPSENVYTITFHMGYTDQTTTATRKEGTTLGSIGNPSWTGHTFDGWYTEETDGEKVTANTVITKDLDVYAHWTVLTYSITYKYNGGTVSAENPVAYTSETRSSTKITYPERNGYALTKVTITGDTTGTEFVKTGEDLSGGWRTGLGESFTENVTVSFTWTAVPFEISYNTTHGTFSDGTHENIIKIKDGEITEGTYQIPTRERYTFGYWITKKDGEETQVAVNSNGIPVGGVTENMTLGAYWIANLDTVIYDANGGTFTGGTKTNKVSYVAWNIYNSTKYTVPTRDGYEFTGWYKESSCKNKLEMNEAENGPEEFGSAGAEYTYYAGWKANTYTITYDLAGGKLPFLKFNPTSYTPDDEITLVNPEKDGYIFLGWSEDNGETYTRDLMIPKGTSGNKSYLAVYEEDNTTVTITYDLAGGSMPDGTGLKTKVLRTEEAFALASPVRTGYIFDGWIKTGSDSSNPVKNLVIDPATESSEITVTAVWHEPKTLTVTYMPENGASAQSRNVKEGTKISSLPSASWTGYTFDGWYTEKEGGDKAEPGFFVTDDITLYGHWTANVHSIKYIYNGGILEDGKENPTEFSVKEKMTITYPTRSGYKLIKVTYASADDSYVKTGDDMSGYISTGLGKVFDADITITFEWEQTPFKVTFHTTSGTFDDGTNENVLEVTDGKLVSGEYKVPEREGYELSKWFLTGDTEKTEVPLNENGIPVSGVTVDMDLYASWSAKTYIITYDLDGGQMSGAYKTRYTIATDDFTLPVPVKTGYSFAGWTGSNGTEEQTEVTVTKGTTGDLSYKAGWLKNYTLTFHQENGASDFTVTVREGDALSVLPAAPSKGGYTFIGWFLKDDTEVTAPYAVSGNLDVYAKWEKNKQTYTISLTLNDGEMADKSVSAVTDDDGVLAMLADPERSGYEFTGWYFDVALTNKVTFPVTFTQNSALFAGWEKEPEKIPVVLTGDTALLANVTFDGAASEEELIYKLAAADEATQKAVADGGVLISSAEEKLAAGTKEGKTALTFGDVTFNKEGTYTFRVSLSNISAPDGWTYDLTVQTIKVTVTANGNKLAASVTGNNPSFTNTYAKPSSVSVVLTGETAITVETSVFGANAEEIFAFRIEGADEATREALTNGVVAFASDTATSGYKLEESEVKTITFEDIAITEAGTYKFRISETNASPADTMWTYANTEADAQIVTVNVEKSGKTYKVSIANNGASFTNMYGKDISSPVILKGEHAIKVYSAVSGADSSDTFTYLLEPQNQAAKDAVVAGIITIDSNTASTSGTISSGTRQTVTFGNVTFNRTGVYTFTIKETNTSVPENWTYANTDADAVTVTVTITKNIEAKTVSYTVTYDNTVFMNSYTAPVSTYVTPQQYGAVENDTGDDTAAFNSALAAVANTESLEKVYVPAGTYKINATNGNGIRLLSNTKLEMAAGAVLEVISNDQKGYDCIIADSISNASVTGGKIVGDRTTHNGTEGEWGHGIGIYDSTYVTVTGVTVTNCWGDGVYIGTHNESSLTARSTNITLKAVTTDNNRRNGLSIVAGDDISVEGCLFANTNGCDPQYGIDIETNHWKDGDKSANKNITITNTTCTGNAKGSIGFVTWCDNVTVKDSTMGGSIYNQMGQNVTFDNTTVSGSSHTLNRGLIMKNGSYFEGGSADSADTCIIDLDMSDTLAGALNKYYYDEENMGSAITDDADSSCGKALFLLRAQDGTRKAGVGYAMQILSNGAFEALTSGKQYRIEWTAKAVCNTTTWINSQTSYGSTGGFSYPWTVHVAGMQNLESDYHPGRWDFCPESYYSTFCNTFTAKGSENAIWILDLSKAKLSGLYIENIKLYEVS